LADLIGVWAKRGGEESSAPQPLNFLNEGLFGIIPFGNLDDSSRNQLINLINEKKLYSYKSAEKRFKNNRLVYVYNFDINTANLVEVLKTYMSLSGNGDPSQLSQEEYATAPPINIEATFDIISRQVVEIKYPQNRTETFSGYGLFRQTDIPTQSIPIEDLQKKLGETQT